MRYFVLTLLFLSTAFAQKPAFFPDADRADKIKSTAPVVEQIFKDHAERFHLPGLVYGVVADGKLVYSGGFGYTDLDKKTPTDATSMFRIASMSKSFTALAILQLRDAGKLCLDDPADKYLPEMKYLKPLTTDAPVITIRHLLSHSAGFPEDNPWGDRQLADTDDELMQLIKNGVSFSNVPGIEYEYSNLGFALLGQIVQRVSGMPFQQYMAEHVFRPLGMNHTVYEYDDVPANKLALGYGWRNDEWFGEPLLHHGSFGAMGGLITSIEDFARYVSLHLAAWPPRSGADSGPLKRSSLREMHQPWRFSGLNPRFRYASGRTCAVATAYAYGLRWMRDCDGRVYLGHSGGLPGFGSNWTMMPDFGIAVLSFDNRTYAATSTINVTVLDTIIALTGIGPRELPPSQILEKRKSELVAMLPDFKSAESSGLFAENFFLDTPLVIWKERAKDVFEKAGAIKSVGAMKPENQLRGTFTMEGEKKNIQVFFTLTPEKNPLIQQLRIRDREK